MNKLSKSLGLCRVRPNDWNGDQYKLIDDGDMYYLLSIRDGSTYYLFEESEQTLHKPDTVITIGLCKPDKNVYNIEVCTFDSIESIKPNINEPELYEFIVAFQPQDNTQTIIIGDQGGVAAELASKKWSEIAQQLSESKIELTHLEYRS